MTNHMSDDSWRVLGLYVVYRKFFILCTDEKNFAFTRNTFAEFGIVNPRWMVDGVEKFHLL